MTVVDASVWVSALSAPEARHASCRGWLADQPSGLTIPSLAIAEVAGAVARATSSGEDGRNAMRIMLLTPGLRVVSVDRAIGEEAGHLAARYRLRGADAIYVAVARLLTSPLATLDHEIQQRAAPVVDIISL